MALCSHSQRDALCAAALTLLGTGAHAAPVAIVNPGFELPYFGPGDPGTNNNVTADGSVLPGAFSVGDPPGGWSAFLPNGPVPSAFIGVLNPNAGTFFVGGAPQGNNVLLLYVNSPSGGAAYGVQQQLTATLAADTHYSLTVQVGNIASGSGGTLLNTGCFGSEGFPGYRVQLLAGDSLLAEDNSSLSPGEGLWALSTVNFASSAAPAQLGLPLAIRLINLNGPATVTNPLQNGVEVDFDDVRLDAMPLTAVPLPPMTWLAALALLPWLRRRNA